MVKCSLFSELCATPILNTSPIKDIKFTVNTSAYFNDVNALKYMKRTDFFSEAGILKGKVRLISFLFLHSLYW